MLYFPNRNLKCLITRRNTATQLSPKAQKLWIRSYRQPDTKDAAELCRCTLQPVPSDLLFHFANKKGIFWGAGWIASEWVYKMIGLAKSWVLLKEGKIFLFSLLFKVHLWNKTPLLSFVWQNRKLEVKINLKHQSRLQMQYTLHFFVTWESSFIFSFFSSWSWSNFHLG